MFPSQFDEEKIMEGLLAIDDATVAMIGTVIELLGAVLLMFNFTLGSKLLMLFTTCVTPIMHPFWATRGTQRGEGNRYDHVF